MIAVGVDTHKHEHVARALDRLGQIVGELSVPASLDGYQAFADWLSEFGGPIRVGIEGTGSFGAGLCEFLVADGVDVVEVERPRRKDRRHGKSDGIDAPIAARKVLADNGLAIPRAGGSRQALAALLMVYRATVAERVRVVNQLQSLHTTAPLAMRERIGPGNGALHDPEARADIERRRREGKTRREANRALKRHLSRQRYKTLIAIPLTS